jgi:hypothetical protein
MSLIALLGQALLTILPAGPSASFHLLLIWTTWAPASLSNNAAEPLLSLLLLVIWQHWMVVQAYLLAVYILSAM